MLEVQYSTDDQLFCEILKTMLLDKTISYSSFKKRRKVKIESDIESNLYIIHYVQSKQRKYYKIKVRIKNIREEKYKGIITRANAKWNVHHM